MDDQPEPHPEEDRLLALWRFTEGRLKLVDKVTEHMAWELAAGDAWRAQIAYRDAVTDRLTNEEAEERIRRNRPIRDRRAGRRSARASGL